MRGLLGPLGAGLLLALSCLSPAGDAAAQERDFSGVEIRSLPVAPGLHMLVGEGGNIGVWTGEDGVVLIDDQFAPLHDRIVAAVAAIQSGPIRFLLNTHWHGDHTGGNEALGGKGSLIVAHDNVRERMSTEQFVAAFDRRVPPAPPAALPVVTFGDDVTLHLNGEAAHVFHVPHAHTDGDAVVHLPGADAIHAGDVYFAGAFPFIDLSSGGSISGLIAAVDRIVALATPGTKIIPGHGPLSDRAELQRYRDMLVFSRDAVSEAMNRGESLEQIVAGRLLADYEEAWGGGFIKADGFVKLVHASLTAGR